MSMAVTVDFGGHTEYAQKMNKIKKSLKNYSGYASVASSLGKFTSQEMVAALIGCIIPESGSNHTILNAKEYKGRGADGTEGWNCGEGLIQWTYWKYKLPLIQRYNNDSRSTQKLPVTWEQYKQGTPISKGNSLYAVQDGRHIAGLTLDNQMLFLVLYYNSLINQLKDETNLAVIVAKIYQQKAGQGYMSSMSGDPIGRAYETAERYYHSSAGNHYLQSVKIAQEYLGAPIKPSTVPVQEYTYTSTSTQSYSEPVKTVSPQEIASLNNKYKKETLGHVMGYHLRQK